MGLIILRETDNGPEGDDEHADRPVGYYLREDELQARDGRDVDLFDGANRMQKKV